MPVYDYDHIEEYATISEHDPENLVLLCPNHHRDKTSGRLSKDSVANARRSPYNLTKAATTPYGIERANALRVFLGSNETLASPPADCSELWINGESFVTVHWEDGFYTYSARVTDETGTTLLSVDRGALGVSTDVWDYRYEGRTVSIRGGSGRILLEADISDREFRINRGSFVDQFSTGLVVEPSGDAVLTMSGVEVGRFASAQWRGQGFAVVRESCWNLGVPAGFGYVRTWSSEYERRMADLKSKMESGAKGRFPRGLSKFIPFPQTR